MNGADIGRRGFLVTSAALGGGMVLGFGAEARKGSATIVPWGPDAAAGTEFSPWIEIAPDDIITVRVPTPECGNGALSQAAMNVAEELQCDWSKVRVAFASIRRDFDEKGAYQTGFLSFFSGHSTGKQRLQKTLQLGASARERLKAAAGARWGVPASEIVARNSLLTHAATKRQLRYGEVAAEAAKIALPVEPALKPQSEWTLLGKKSPPKIYNPQIADGSAVYGMDVKLPGMVHAALLQCPVHGGKLKSHNPEAVLKMPGVRAVVVVDRAKTKGSPVPQKSTFGLGDSLVQSGIAVIADHYWQAKMALDALPVEWDMGEGARWKDAETIYAAAISKRDLGKGSVIRKAGDVATATGKRVVEADYGTPYCENAALEPLNTTAMVSAESCEVWSPTQDMGQAYWVAVDETGLPPEKVKLHQTFMGGAFGRRGQGDDVRMAVAVAKEFPGRPVKVIWSREEGFKQGRYRTPIFTKFRATLDDASGMPQAISGDAVYVGTRPAFQLPLGYSDQPYFNSGFIPNVKLTSTSFPVNILNGAFRAPCYNSYAFMVESFIDECAHAAGADPLAYRLKLLESWSKSWNDCLRLAAEKIGWGRALPKGEGLGIAISCWPVANVRENGTVIATAVRVAVSKEGAIAIKQIEVAFDCGRIANADAVRAQIEGATLYGLNVAMNEEMTVSDGAMVESNFHEYAIGKMADTPPVGVHFEALSGHSRMEIIGEAPVGPVQAAVANAIFAATGKRIRRTPFRKTDVSWA
jgi:isoquinoline 1-oxidoreductase subunit beta